MRVTENTNFDAIRGNINRSKSKMENLQTQSATMKKLNTPSDDPVGAAKVLEMRTDKVNNDQFQTNAKLAETFLNNSDLVLSDLTDVVMRAKEIALGQSSGASSTDETRAGVAEEIGQLYQHAVAAANRKVGERYLFGGYKTQKPPVDEDGRYQGDDGQMMVEIAKGVFLSMNVPGLDVFNTNPKSSSDTRRKYDDAIGARAPASLVTPTDQIKEDSLNAPPQGQNVNLFDELQNLRIGLLTGNLDGVRDTLDRFDQVQSKLIATRAKIGSRVSGLQSTSQSLERHNITNSQLSSAIEDADMTQVVSDLAKEETVFRSALASSKNLVQPTLMEFLK